MKKHCRTCEWFVFDKYCELNNSYVWQNEKACEQYHKREESIVAKTLLEEASIKSGIYPTKLSDLENGKRVPTAEDIEQLSKLFGVNSETLLVLSKRLETVDRKSDRFLKIMSEALIKFFADCKESKI